ncbi:MAG: hypothetical protein KAU23_02085, partial [Anaerolineales bacterium]|nr:hypothetical protein [Anaerolineales bacterium]
VFAHSNQARGESALILYHNKWAETQGTIFLSTKINGVSVTLLDGLGLIRKDSSFILFREHITNLEYIRSAADFRNNGISIDLGAYKYQVFLDFREVTDPDGDFALLNSSLQGKGVSNLQEKLLEIKLSPLLAALDDLVSSCLSGHLPDILLSITQIPDQAEGDTLDVEERFSQKLSAFTSDLTLLHPETHNFPTDYHVLVSSKLEELNNCYIFNIIGDDGLTHILYPLLFWVIFSEFTEIVSPSSLLEIFRHSLSQPFTNRLLDSSDNKLLIAISKVLFSLSSQANSIVPSPKEISSIWFSNHDILVFLGIHDYNVISWFNQEAFEFLLDLTMGVLYINCQTESRQSNNSKQRLYLEIREIKRFMISSLKLSSCNLELFNAEISKYSASSSE